MMHIFCPRIQPHTGGKNPYTPLTVDDDVTTRMEDQDDAPNPYGLNASQRRAFDVIFSRGGNVFITGPAGTGKSFLLRSIIHYARSALDKNVGVTASTGNAALQLGAGATTVHSFLGIGMGRESAEALARAAPKRIVERIRSLDILVIDEISMISADLLAKISEYLCMIRRDDAPFGGIQIVLCGDFCQLGPVEGAFCFLAPIWRHADVTIAPLDQLMRQAEDGDLVRILEQARWGNLDDEAVATLRRLRRTRFPPGIDPTVLLSNNRDVERINASRFEALVSSGAARRTYRTTWSREGAAHAREWMRRAWIPEGLDLCVGAQVLLTHNLDPASGLVNGARGVVVAVDEASSGPVVRFVANDGIQRTIAPIRRDIRGPSSIASRGDNVVIDQDVVLPSGSVVPGGTRGRVTRVDIDEHGRHLAQLRVLGGSGNATVIVPSDAIRPESSATTGADAAWVQYTPLRLAYALTVHRSQGMTLDAAVVSLDRRIFAPGQAYTALSRVKNLASLRVVDVHADAFRTDDSVSRFYER